MDNLEDSGLWNEALLQEHTNYQELMAIWLGLQSFLPHMQKRVTQIYSDDQTAVAHLHKQGGGDSVLETVLPGQTNSSLVQGSLCDG